jgi:hypothetical protein
MSDKPEQPPPVDDNGEEVDNGQEEPQSEPGEPPGPSADMAALIETIRSEGIAYRNEEQREDTGKKWREWITIGLLICTFIAVSWQVYEMIKVYGPIAEQARAATRQAENSEKALIASQRAWVGPQNATLSAEPSAGMPLDITVQYQNSGRDPALGFVSAARTFTATESEIIAGTAAEEMQSYMKACKTGLAEEHGRVVYPTTSGLGSGYTFTQKVPGSLIDDAVVSGAKTLIVEGCFLYRTFGVPRHSYFCYFYQKGTTNIQALNICRSGHDAD